MELSDGQEVVSTVSAQGGVDAASLSEEEVIGLISAVKEEGGVDAANFVGELPGNLWYMPESMFGLRSQARDWGQKEGLVTHKIEGEEGKERTFVVLTNRGEAFKAALEARGITIFMKTGAEAADGADSIEAV